MTPFIMALLLLLLFHSIADGAVAFLHTLKEVLFGGCEVTPLWTNWNLDSALSLSVCLSQICLWVGEEAVEAKDDDDDDAVVAKKLQQRLKKLKEQGSL